MPSKTPRAVVPEPAAAAENGANHTNDRLASDLLYGSEQISQFLGWPIRRVRHALLHRHIPATKSGVIWIASKQRLKRHFQAETAEQ